MYSRFVGPFTVGAHGGEARRSDAQRHAREEQRREEYQQQRDARVTGKKPPARRVDDTPWWRKVPGSL